jgi:hypothetical protein
VAAGDGRHEACREHAKPWGAGEVRLGSGLKGKMGLVAKLVWRVFTMFFCASAIAACAV